MKLSAKQKNENKLLRKMLNEKGVTAITIALGHNGDFDWDKAWEWYEDPKRTQKQTMRILTKIGCKAATC